MRAKTYKFNRAEDAELIGEGDQYHCPILTLTTSFGISMFSLSLGIRNYIHRDLYDFPYEAAFMLFALSMTPILIEGFVCAAHWRKIRLASRIAR